MGRSRQVWLIRPIRMSVRPTLRNDSRPRGQLAALSAISVRGSLRVGPRTGGTICSSDGSWHTPFSLPPLSLLYSFHQAVMRQISERDLALFIRASAPLPFFLLAPHLLLFIFIFYNFLIRPAN